MPGPTICGRYLTLPLSSPISDLRPSAAVLYCFGFGCITTLGFGAKIQALSDHVIDATFAAMGCEIAFDRMFVGTLAVFERLDTGTMDGMRAFPGGFRISNSQE